MQPTLVTPNPSPRATVNRLNAVHSTGPRTTAGKLRPSRNALRHGLTAASPVLPSEDPAAYDTHRLRQNLGVQSNRLSRQFHKALDQLRAIQSDRSERNARDLKTAAALFELDKSKGIEYDPARDGFVFSRSEVETHSHRLTRQNEAHHFAYIRFYADPKFVRAAGT